MVEREVSAEQVLYGMSKFLEKNYREKNKLCSIFVVNAIKELSLRCVAVQLSYSDMVFNRIFSV